MAKQRIISALIVLAVVIPIIIIGGYLFQLLILIVGMIGLKEFMDISEEKRKIPNLIKIMAFIIFIIMALNNVNNNSFIFVLDYRILVLSLLMFLFTLIIYQNNKNYNINDALILVGVTLFLGMAFNLAILVRNYDIKYLLLLILLFMTTDTFAYATGKLVGRYKLIPSISPGKHWEGTIVGTLMAVLICGYYYHEIIDPNVNLLVLGLIIMTLSLIGQIGDLVFSSIKRYYNKKDFSNIMPGHGGILDRFDSFIFILLAFTFFITII